MMAPDMASYQHMSTSMRWPHHKRHGSGNKDEPLKRVKQMSSQPNGITQESISKMRHFYDSVLMQLDHAAELVRVQASRADSSGPGELPGHQEQAREACRAANHLVRGMGEQLEILPGRAIYSLQAPRTGMAVRGLRGESGLNFARGHWMADMFWLQYRTLTVF
jgi:hypothetical protein